MGSLSHVSGSEVKHGSWKVPCLTSDPETCEKEPTFKFHSDHFGALNIEIGSEMAKLVKITSNIDLNLLASVFDLRS